jgi:hypothetical protein
MSNEPLYAATLCNDLLGPVGDLHITSQAKPRLENKADYIIATKEKLCANGMVLMVSWSDAGG